MKYITFRINKILAQPKDTWQSQLDTLKEEMVKKGYNPLEINNFILSSMLSAINEKFQKIIKLLKERT